MRYLILLIVLAGCSTFAMHAESNGDADIYSDGTYFAAEADGVARVDFFKDGELWKQYKIDKGTKKAWKRSGWSIWKKGNWKEVDFDEAMAIIDPGGVMRAPH